MSQGNVGLSCLHGCVMVMLTLLFGLFVVLPDLVKFIWNATVGGQK